MQHDIQRIQEKMQELRRLAVELDEELSVLRNEIDARGSNPPADGRLVYSGVTDHPFATALASGAPCGPKVEGGDAKAD